MATGIVDLPETEAGELILSAENASYLFVPNGLDRIIAQIKSEVASHIPDISTERGRKEIASLARKVASSKTRMDDYGKELVAKIKAQSGIIDAERKRMRDVLDQLRDDTRRPLTDWEDAEENRVAEHENALSSLAELGNVPFGASLEEITGRLDAADKYVTRDWQEFVNRFSLGHEFVVMRLTKLSEETRKAAEEKAELLRLQEEAEKRRIAEHELRLQEEAAARAKEQAELSAKRVADELARKVEEDRTAIARSQAEAEARAARAEEAARQAEAKAVRDAEEAAAKAKRDQEQAIEAERKRVAEIKRVEEEATAKREANKRHVSEVHRQILNALVGLNLSEENANIVVDALAAGKIPSVKVIY